MKKHKKIVAALVAIGFISPAAYATNGMNLEGYGPIAAAMGGASQAYDNGTAAVMNNPATLGLMPEGTRIDVAIGLLSPSITANGPTGSGMSAESGANTFIMPAVGFATKKDKFTYGAGLFAQGGMGTEYSANSFMAAGSGEVVRSEVGVGRFIVPLAYQIDDKLTVAGSVDYVWAEMDLKMALLGSQFLDMMPGANQTNGSVSGSMVNTLGGAMGTNPGQLNSTNPINFARVDFSDSDRYTGAAKGAGMAGKLGATYKFSKDLTVGMSYHSKTALGDLTTNGASMSMNVNVNNSSGGTTVTPVLVTGSVAVKNFQWPETIAVGAAYQVNEQLMLVADYKYIGWKDVMKNFSMTFTADAAQTGAAGAFGLGGKSVDMTLKQNWDDQNVLQFGGAYKTTPDLTLRAGVNLANNPVPDQYMNPLFPAIAKTNVTVGAGYNFNKVSSVDFNYAYVPKITGGVLSTSTTTVDFSGYSAQIMYSHRI